MAPHSWPVLSIRGEHKWWHWPATMFPTLANSRPGNCMNTAVILLRRGVSWSIHYMDDFLTVGKPNSTECDRNMEIMPSTCEQLGMPLKTKKIEGASPCSTPFLGYYVYLTPKVKRSDCQRRNCKSWMVWSQCGRVGRPVRSRSCYP